MTIASISWKVVRFALKSVIALLMLFYVAAGVMSAISLYMQSRYKAEPIYALETLVDQAALSGDKGEIAAWLSSRPLAETPAELKILIPESAPLSPQSFFAIFRRELKLGHPKEALFWLQLGRYRLLYDLLRCGGTPEEERMLNKMLNIMPSPQIDALIRAHPEYINEALQRVLDFDAQYPAADDPALFCNLAVHADQPADRVDWPLYHQALRDMTERHIRATAQKQPAKQAPPPKPAPKASVKKDKKEKRGADTMKEKAKDEIKGAGKPAKK